MSRRGTWVYVRCGGLGRWMLVPSTLDPAPHCDLSLLEHDPESKSKAQKGPKQQAFSSLLDLARARLSPVQAAIPQQAVEAKAAKATTSAVSSASSGAVAAAQRGTIRQISERSWVCAVVSPGPAAAGPGRRPFEERVGVCGEGNEDLRLRIHGHHRMKED